MLILLSPPPSCPVYVSKWVLYYTGLGLTFMNIVSNSSIFIYKNIVNGSLYKIVAHAHARPSIHQKLHDNILRMYGLDGGDRN